LCTDRKKSSNYNRKDSDIQGIPFVEYSSLYWGIHAKCRFEIVRSYLSSGYDDDSNHMLTKIFLEKDHNYGHGFHFDNYSSC